MKHAYSLAVMLLVSYFSNAQQKGELIFSAGFDNKEQMEQWSGTRKIKMVHKDDVTAVRIKSKQTALLSYNLPMDKMRGSWVSVSGRVKATVLTVPAHHWNGLKIMLRIYCPTNTFYPQIDFNNNSTEWQTGTCSAFIPFNADSVELLVGLEEVKGKAWFDDVRISIKSPGFKLSAPELPVAATSHNHTELRGTMVATTISENDLRVLGSWGANLVRWQLTWNGFPNSPADTSSLDNYLTWLHGALQHLDSMLPLCKELGIKVIVDLHTLPGGMIKSAKGLAIFDNKKWQDAFIDIWKDISTRYATSSVVWGYDLANEPYAYNISDSVSDWEMLATTTAKMIRKTDNVHTIIVEGAPGGTIPALVSMHPIDVPGIVYSFHLYEPDVFTGQGIKGSDISIHYPGNINGMEWNKLSLSKALQPIRDWQMQNNASIYIGEFSAVRWAPGESAYYYLRDCIELFEEAGWNWTYHAFREYQGWNVEIGNNKADETPAATPTLRQQLLMDAFKKNKD